MGIGIASQTVYQAAAEYKPISAVNVFSEVKYENNVAAAASITTTSRTAGTGYYLYITSVSGANAVAATGVPQAFAISLSVAGTTVLYLTSASTEIGYMRHDFTRPYRVAAGSAVVLYVTNKGAAAGSVSATLEMVEAP